MPCRLNGIRVENNALLAAYSADFGNRLNRSYLIICKHNRYKAGIGADCRFNLVCGYYTVFVNIEQSYFKALLFKLFERVQNCVMLKSR